MGITDTHSYSHVLRDVVFAKICTLPFFEGFTARRSKQLPIEPYHLPYLGVWIVSDHAVPDGDWNAGNIRWMVDLKLGISVMMEDNDTVALDLKLDEAFWAIQECWRSQFITNFLDTYDPSAGVGNPDNVRFEGVYRYDRRVVYGAPRKNNETPLGELQYEPTLRYRWYVSPVITDDLERIVVDVVPLHHGEVPPEDVVQRIIAKYEFRTQ